MRFIKNKYVIIAVIVVIVGVIVYFRTRSSAPSFETAKVALGDVVETVSVTGTVTPINKADLSFEKSGVITAIDVKVGDQVKQGDPIASLDTASDQAAVDSAEATLADMERSLTPEELAVQKATVSSAETALASAQSSAVNASHDALTAAQSAVFNDTDTFFSYPQTNPSFTIPVSSLTSETTVNNMDSERGSVSQTFASWSNDLVSDATSTAATNNAAGLLSDTQNYLATIKLFMTDLAGIIDNLNPGNSGLSQAVIASDVVTMNAALSAVNGAIDSVTAAETALSNASSSLGQAKSDYQLKLAGNSADSIAAQAAKVTGAQAALAEDILIAPTDGLITVVTPTVGEFATPGTPLFSIQSNDGYEVDAYVAEADIAKVAVGDQSSTTLDAYGSDVNFEASVTAIDPAETVLEGVPTYKVTLMFNQNDPRIRSGMTANLEILTHEADNVLSVPTRAVIDNNGSKTVRVVNADGKTYTTVPVTVGLKGSDGTTEITSGLTAGQTVVTYLGTDS